MGGSAHLVPGLFSVVSASCEAHTLLVLCEEELVAVDLLSEDWPQFRLPYLIHVHASPTLRE